MAVGTSDHKVQLWDVEKQRQVRSMDGHSARVSSLAWNRNLLSSGGRDSLIRTLPNPNPNPNPHPNPNPNPNPNQELLLPFCDVVDWRLFSVRVPPERWREIPEI